MADAGEQRLHLLGVADVADDVHARQQVGGHHLGASRPQLVGEGRPDASAATRDDDPLAGDGHASAASASWMCPFEASTLASPGPRLSGPPWNASIRPPASVINREPAPTSHA